MATNIQRSVTAILKSIEEDLEQVRTEFLKNMAEELVSRSPVDTGAYVTSHSIRTTSGAGRMRTSEGKPTQQSAPAKREEALGQLLGDIASLPPDATKVYINNKSPHNKFVEFGGFNWKTTPYLVYTHTFQNAGSHLSAAVAKVKGSR